MRLRQLSLRKYGHFDGCDLLFPQGPMDFHLIYGPNEAGKSTTMSAVQDLLFGFPHAKAYHFRFDATLLRVGASLDTGHGTLAVQRRRGDKNTLMDEAGAAVPEAPLRAALHGLGLDDFRQKFSLDHARLRLGGRAIVDARDDVGQALFAAGSGLLGVQELLTTLEAEADAVWAERRAQGRTYWQAERQMQDAERRLKDALVRPKAWRAAQDTLDSLAARQAELEARRSSAQATLDRLQRIRRLVARAQQRCDLLAILQTAPPPFDASHDRVHEQATQAIAEARLRLPAAERALEEARARRTAITPDQALLRHQEAIGALVEDRGKATKAAQDLTGVEAERDALQAEAERLSRELALAPAPAAPMLEALPSPGALALLGEQVTLRQNLEVRCQAARDQLARDRQTLALAEAGLEAGARPGPGTDFTAALRTGQAARAVSARLAERQRAVAAATRGLQTALLALPWSGAPSQLARRLPPPPDVMRTEEAAWALAERLAQEAAHALQAAVQSGERLDEQVRQACRGRTVSTQDLVAQRSRRDAHWARLRAQLAAGQTPQAETCDVFEAAIATADQLADDRFETAEASARLAALHAEAALARLDERHARARAERVQSDQAQREQAWHAQLTGSGLPALPPASLRQWTEHRQAALLAIEALAQARELQEADEREVGSARDTLAAMCGGILGPDAALPAVLEAVQRLADQAEAAARLRLAGETEAKAAERAVGLSARRLLDAQRDLTAWETGWTETVARSALTLDPAALPALLPRFERLRAVLEACLDKQGRVAGMQRDQRRFEANALRLAAACAIVQPDLDAHAMTEQLRHGLQRALEDDRAAREQDQALRTWQQQAQSARHSIAAAEAVLAPLLAIAGAQDHAGLTAALASARLHREAGEQLRALDQSILADGDGYTLEALLDEIAGADPDSLSGAAEQARATVVTLDADIAATATALGEARQSLAALDHGADAPLAAADEQQARAAMAAEAETYLLRRAQAVLLRATVEEYRARQESPLLSRASALFRMLTLGRYSRLEIDRTTQPARLLGQCGDGRTAVGLDGMSDGTIDQLFLALRLAALEQSVADGLVLPFLADDLFINFDDRRAHAGFRVLGEVARRTQVLFFTHHDHLRAIAQDALGPHTVSVCELAAAA